VNESVLTEEFLKDKVVSITLSYGLSKKIFTVEFGKVIKTWGGNLNWAKGLKFRAILNKFKKRGFKVTFIKVLEEYAD
jgi:predicted SpoU family rRNA methylase